jgi:hypothetical protein
VLRVEKGEARSEAPFFSYTCQSRNNEKTFSIKFQTLKHFNMKTTSSGRYIPPAETTEDQEKFKRYNDLILQAQQNLTDDPRLPYSNVTQLCEQIELLRSKAKALNKKYRLSRKVY